MGSVLVRLVKWLVLACAVGMIFAPPPAHACGAEVETETNADIARIHDAQDALDEGDLDTASELTARALRYAGGGDADAVGVSPTWDRAIRIQALARVRDKRSS